MTDPTHPTTPTGQDDTFTPQTPAQKDLQQRMQDDVPREGSRAHTHDEPDDQRLALGGARPEAQPRTQADRETDEAMQGDNGQTRQPQSSGMVQPDGGVNQGSNTDNP